MPSVDKIAETLTEQIQTLKDRALGGLVAKRDQAIQDLKEIEAEIHQIEIALAKTFGGTLRPARSANGSGTRIRRSRADIVGMMDSIVQALVRSKATAKAETNPTVGELSGMIPGSSTKDLQVPIKELIELGALKVHGEKRGTRYFVTSKDAEKFYSEKAKLLSS